MTFYYKKKEVIEQKQNIGKQLILLLFFTVV